MTQSVLRHSTQGSEKKGQGGRRGCRKGSAGGQEMTGLEGSGAWVKGGGGGSAAVTCGGRGQGCGRATASDRMYVVGRVQGGSWYKAMRNGCGGGQVQGPMLCKARCEMVAGAGECRGGVRCWRERARMWWRRGGEGRGWAWWVQSRVRTGDGSRGGKRAQGQAGAGTLSGKSRLWWVRG